VGLVLSGGGSGAGFQLGALRYLYDTEGMTPTVITGTSAGSILAALLAQADDHQGQRSILGDIDRIGQGLQLSSDMLIPLDWFSELQKLTPALQKVAGPRPAPQEPRTLTLPSLGLRPTRKSHNPFDGPTIRLPRWDASPAMDTLGFIWSLSRSGARFDALLKGAQRERSMFRPGPIFDALLAPDVFDPDRLARSQTELRIAVVALESGELRYVTGTGALVDRENREVSPPGSVSVPDAIRASCAIPGVFPPVLLGDEHYVDGGTRENAPVDIAVTHLGVDRCYAIISLPKGLEREPSYAHRDMLSIVLRSTAGIMADEVQLNDVSRARAAGAVVIAPEINLLGVLTVDPGLLAIATDYGYLRAAEACQRATEAEQQLTRNIVEARRAAWSTENYLFGPEAVPAAAAPAQYADLVDLKLRLRDLVQQAPAGRLPAGAELWWRGWEGHPYPIAEEASWARRAGSPDAGPAGVSAR
jgi:predicted acylesterase/phospholipase RssA